MRTGPRGVVVALGVALLCAASVASAQQTLEGRRRRIAILILSGDGVESEFASDLTEVLIAAVGSGPDREVIGKEELQARLGQDDARSRQCVESPICLSNVGAALAVDEIIAGTVSARPGGFALALVRQEIASGDVRGRFARDVQGGPTALAPALQEAAVALYREPERPPELRIDSNVEGAEVFVDDRRVGLTPLRLTDLAPGSHAVRVDAMGYRAASTTVALAAGAHESLRVTLREAPEERRGPARRPPSPAAVVVTWGSAGLAIAAGALGAVMAVRSQRELESGLTQVEAAGALDDRETEALVANVAFAGAGVLGAVALFMLVFQNDAVFGAEAAP